MEIEGYFKYISHEIIEKVKLSDMERRMKENDKSFNISQIEKLYVLKGGIYSNENDNEFSPCRLFICNKLDCLDDLIKTGKAHIGVFADHNEIKTENMPPEKYSQNAMQIYTYS